MFNKRKKSSSSHRSYFLGFADSSEPVRADEKQGEKVKETKKHAVRRIKPIEAARALPPVEAEETVTPEKASPAEAGATPPDTDFARSLDGAFGVYADKQKNPKKKITAADKLRYALLFVCILGFLFAGFFVIKKLYSYYQANQINKGLQNILSKKDVFEEDYLAKAQISLSTLTISERLSGKSTDSLPGSTALSATQQNTITKLRRLAAINPDCAGWISISGTVVDYPVVWSQTRSYYLHRDFYGDYLPSGTIYIDSRNEKDISLNRNTVLYGHNMSDGSMFASLHDFSNENVFNSATVEIATENGIYVYTPFAVQKVDAFDNYFETDFKSDADFLDFCAQMMFRSIHQVDYEFTKDSRIITLSTCAGTFSNSSERFAVHAVLTKVIK